jgi:hypothetical protein
MAMWTVAQDGGQTVFLLEDQFAAAPSSRLSTVLKHACGTAFNTRQSQVKLKTLGQFMPKQPNAQRAASSDAPQLAPVLPNFGQVIDMTPPRMARLSMVDDQDDTLSLEAEDKLYRPGLCIDNHLGRIRYSLDKTVVTFEPKAGGSVTFVDCGDDRVQIIATSPDGMERRYPSNKAAFKAALKLKNGNVNWLGGRYFAFEQCSHTFKDAQGKGILTISDLEYSEAGHLTSFSLPNGDRWVAIQGTTFYECLEASGKAKYPVPLQLGPLVLREDGLHAHGADAQYNIGVPLKQGSLKACVQAGFPHEAVQDAAQSKLSDVFANQSAQPCSIQTWQKSAKQRHQQSVSLLTGKANPHHVSV